MYAISPPIRGCPRRLQLSLPFLPSFTLSVLLHLHRYATRDELPKGRYTHFGHVSHLPFFKKDTVEMHRFSLSGPEQHPPISSPPSERNPGYPWHVVSLFSDPELSLDRKFRNSVHLSSPQSKVETRINRGRTPVLTHFLI